MLQLPKLSPATAHRLRAIIATVFSILCAYGESFAQQPALPPVVAAELMRRGLTEREVTLRLDELGLDLSRMTEEELIFLEPELRRIIDDLEREKNDGRTIRRPSAPGRSPVPDTLPPVRRLGEKVISADERMRADSLAQLDSTRLAQRDSLRIRDSVLFLQSQQIYGHELFANGALSVYRATDAQDAPASYVIGPGDELSISVFGESQVDLLLTVDELGFIAPPRLSNILVRGLNVAQARQLVRARLRDYYLFTEGQFAMNVRGSRTLRVNVFGEVVQSGTYAMAAINGSLNALVAAGGPTERGSVRRIQRSRGSDRVTIDLYRYLTDPSEVAEDLSLQDGDIVFVPVARSLVEVRGAVRRPMRYELLEGERLADLIEFAGGLSSNAFDSLVQVQRLIEGRLTTIDVDYATEAPSGSMVLVDGDVVSIRAIDRPARENVVVRGAVELEGDLAFRQNQDLASLVRNARLRRNARTDVAFVRRTNPDSTVALFEVNVDEALLNSADAFALQAGDTVEILAQNVYADASAISVTGAVREPVASMTYANDSSLTVAAAILLAGGLSPNAAQNAIIFRRGAQNKKVVRYQMVGLEEEASVVRLNPFDSLVVFPRELFTDSFQIEVKGAVRRPGRYVYDPSLGLKQLLTLAGGFRQEAKLNRVEVFRLEFGTDKSTETRLGTITLDAEYNVVASNLDVRTLQPYDVIAVRSAPEYEVIQQVEVEGEVTYPGAYPLNSEIRTVYDLLVAAGQVTTEAFPEGATLYRSYRNAGYIILELEEILEDPSSPNNIVLAEGDVLTIPKAIELVTIRSIGTQARTQYADSLLASGEVVLAYQGKRSARWYIEEYAGGFAKRADTRSVTVRYPSGRYRRTRRVLFFKDYPTIVAGSTISMKLKPVKTRRSKDERVDWAAIAGAVTTALTAGLAVILIAQNLKDP